jgi:hypothetical protein
MSEKGERRLHERRPSRPARWCPKDEVVGIMLTVYYTNIEQPSDTSRGANAPR